MTFQELAEQTGLTLLGPDGVFPLEFKVDSRDVTVGCGFAAFHGANVDGHHYIETAIQHGAKVIVAQRDLLPQGLPGRYLEVSFFLTDESTDLALAKMAQAYLDSLPHLRSIAAVTGSVGKTSTRSFLAQILSEWRPVHSSEGNYNTLIGCAVTALRAPEETQILVLEMGANHQGEIAQMVEYFAPSVACITEVAPAHLEGFGSLEGVLRAKCEIFRSSALKAAVINGDNPLLIALAPQVTDVPLVTVGRSGTLSFSDSKLTWDKGYVLETEFSLVGHKMPFTARVSGVQNLYPLACAIAMALQLGMSFGDAVTAAKKCRSLEGRGEVCLLPGGGWLVDESYNASPKSMEAALSALNSVQIEGRKCVLLGAMGEMGESTESWHRDIFNTAKNMNFSWLRLWGKVWEKLPECQAYRLREWDEVLSKIRDLRLVDGDVMLVKGSNAENLSGLICRLKEERP